MGLTFSKLPGRVIGIDSLLLLVLAGSLGLNVYLGVQRARAPQAAAQESAPLIKSGTAAPVFDAVDVKGAPVSLNFTADTRDTLLYVYSPTCHWCEKNLANIKAIVKARRDLRIVGVSLAKLGNDPVAQEIGFDSIVQPTQKTMMAYGMRATPSTILVSHEGKVLNAWSGAYGGQVSADVSKVLAVNLPGFVD